jgi:hypothetical protein
MRVCVRVAEGVGGACVFVCVVHFMYTYGVNKGITLYLQYLSYLKIYFFRIGFLHFKSIFINARS